MDGSRTMSAFRSWRETSFSNIFPLFDKKLWIAASPYRVLAMTFTAVLSSLVSSLSSNMVTLVNEKNVLYFDKVIEQFYFYNYGNRRKSYS